MTSLAVLTSDVAGLRLAQTIDRHFDAGVFVHCATPSRAGQQMAIHQVANMAGEVVEAETADARTGRDATLDRSRWRAPARQSHSDRWRCRWRHRQARRCCRRHCRRSSAGPMPRLPGTRCESFLRAPHDEQIGQPVQLRQFVGRDLAGKDDVVGDAKTLRQRLQLSPDPPHGRRSDKRRSVPRPRSPAKF